MKKLSTFNFELSTFFVPSRHETTEIRIKNSRNMGRLFTLWGYIRRYKYVVAIVIFLLILGALDENSLWVRYQRQVEIGNLHREIDKFQEQYDRETAQLQSLENNPAAVERLAREKYLMKRENEDIFVFMDANEYQVRNAARQQDADVNAVRTDSLAQETVETEPADSLSAATTATADSTAVQQI